jgi:hypothetical protein
VERSLIFLFSLIAIVFSLGSFFLLNNLLIFGIMDLISLILLGFAFKIYCEKRDNQKYSFLKAINKINYLKSIGGIFGIIYVIVTFFRVF